MSALLACADPRPSALSTSVGGGGGLGKVCTNCHGDANRAPTSRNVALPAAPPSDTRGNTGTLARGVGTHQLHLVGGTLSAGHACTECHVVPQTAAHADGTVALTWGRIATTGGAAPAWNGSTCSNTYCHGSFTGGNASNAPTWTQARANACGTCHGVPPAAPHPQNPRCESCHEGYTQTSVNLANHVNGAVDVAGLACTSCHGDASRAATALNPQLPAAPPVGTRGETAATTRAVGAHARHLTDGPIRDALPCSTCHVLPTSNAHADGTADVAFGSLARTGGVTPAWNGTTCSSTYCHGAFTGGSTANAPTWAQARANACGTCHGLPPAVPHPQSTDCGSCHAGYTASATNRVLHIDGKVDVSGGACTSCHGDAARPATALNPLLPAAPPRDAAGNTAPTARGVGAHQAHLAAGTLRGPMACTECHPIPPAAPHPSGAVELAWGTLATIGGAAPAWNGTALTCSASYCHGATLAGGTNKAPVWTGGAAQASCGTCHAVPPPAPHTASTDCGSCHAGYTSTTVNLANHVNGALDVTGLTCTSCHGDPARAGTALNPQLAAAPPTGTRGETATSTRAVGAHLLHLQDGGLRPALACTECHAVPSSPTHSNGTVDLQWGTLARTGGASPAWSGTTCSNTYCHGNFRNGNATYTPTWTAPAANACGTCHGSPANPAPGGSHPAAAAGSCGSCHAGYTGTSVNPALHMDGKFDVSSMTCTSCHGNAAQAATPAAPLYAAPPVDTLGNSAATFRGVGAHQPHLTGTTLATAPVACTECHAVPTSVVHSDGVPLLVFGPLARTGGSSPAWNATPLTCSATYCHGATLAGGTNKTPAWTSGAAQVACGTCHAVPPGNAFHTRADLACATCHAGYTASAVNRAVHLDGTLDYTVGCTTCHGDPAQTATPAAPLFSAPPRDARGNTATSARGVGTHQLHLVASATHSAVACGECHVVPSSQLHANGTAEVAFGPIARTGGVNPTWNGTTCAGTYCHGAFANGATGYSPTWTAPAASACGTCHGLPPGGTHPSNPTCGSCHSGYTGTTVNAATHANGTVDVTGMACTSCHGDAARAATARNPQLPAAPPAGTLGETATTARAVGAHQAHLAGTRWSGNAVLCTECHSVPTAQVHSNGTVGMTWGTLARTGGFAPTWTGTTCTNYCHGSSLAAGGTNTTPSWTGGAAQADCGTCHGNPPPAPHVQSTSCGSCHAGYTNATVNASLHVNGTLDVSTMTCSSCHGSATNAAPPTGTRGETATTTRAVGAHQAHLVGPTLRSAAIACNECHAVPTAQNHADGAIGMTWGTLARTGGFTPTWTGTTCTNYCHGSSLGAGGTVTAPTWTGGATQVACGTCHGVPPPAPHTTSTACGSCHTGYTATTVNLASHINGVLEATGNHPAGWATGDQHGYQANLTGLAGCKGCHGTDLAGGSSGVSCTACHTSNGFANWATNCTFCHGNRATGRQSPPLDVQGRSVTTNTSVGKHDRHVAATWMNPIACTECHPARTASVITDTAHVDGNGIAEVVFGTRSTTGGASPTYNRTSGTSATCASNYCHGNFTGGATTAAPNWASGAAMTCTSCHGNPPSTGEHGRSQHRNAGCGACHSGYTSSSVSVGLHVNGVKNVGGSGTSINSWNAGTGACGPSCHGGETW